MNTQEILGRLNVIQVEVSCPSGAVSKTTVDRNGNEVFTDGSVRYMDRKYLRPFTAARQAAIRLCRDYGTRFLGGWAIPDESFPEVMKGLEAIAIKFGDEKKQLSGILPVHRVEWEAKHPEVLTYQAKFPTNLGIIEGISISAAAYKIDPKPTGLIGNAVTEAVAGFAGKVLSEVAQEARDSFSPDAQMASSKAKAGLLRIASKLDSLAFVDNTLATVSGLIVETLNSLPDGPLRGRDFVVYAALMKTLMSPAEVVNVAQVMETEGVGADVWTGFAPVDTPATEPVQELFDSSSKDAAATTENAEVPPSAADAAEPKSGKDVKHELSGAQVLPFPPVPPPAPDYSTLVKVQPPAQAPDVQAANWNW